MILPFAEIHGGQETPLTFKFLRRWNYLEAGIDRIMLHLELGIDMHTVSKPLLPLKVTWPRRMTKQLIDVLSL